jgi:hypothetical protein
MPQRLPEPIDYRHLVICPSSITRDDSHRSTPSSSPKRVLLGSYPESRVANLVVV